MGIGHPLRKIEARASQREAFDAVTRAKGVLGREQCSETMAEQMHPGERERFADMPQIVELLGQAPRQVRSIGLAATQAIVEVDRAVGGQRGQRFQVVVRKSRTAGNDQQRRG